MSNIANVHNTRTFVFNIKTSDANESDHVFKNLE